MAKQMNDVERFTPFVEYFRDSDFHAAVMALSDSGVYVHYTDYTALQQQLAAAREALQAAWWLLGRAYGESRKIWSMELMAAYEKADVAQQGGYCTEPDRSVCPRMCMDFCNAYEERFAELRVAFVEAQEREQEWLNNTGHLYDPYLPIDAGIRAVINLLSTSPEPVDATLQRDRQP